MFGLLESKSEKTIINNRVGIRNVWIRFVILFSFVKSLDCLYTTTSFIIEQSLMIRVVFLLTMKLIPHRLTERH